jgi:hypothetical protein
MQAPPGGRSCRHYARAASEAGDHPGGGMPAAMLPYHAQLQAMPAQFGGQLWQQEGALPGGEDKCWFDPLYVEDPLRPQNNVGRNCFRISQIQQAFAQAYTELLHRGTAQASSETRKAGSVLGLMLYRC